MVDNYEAVKSLATAASSGISDKIQWALNAIKRGSIDLLVIEDFNTAGLCGEDFPVDTSGQRVVDDRGTWSALVRDHSISSKTGGGRGSKGVGKGMLWVFSSLSTVMFQSNDSDQLKDLRFGGKCWLPSHTTDSDGAVLGYGWFGTEFTKGFTNKLGDYFEREFCKGTKAQSLCKKFFTRRDHEQGTSIVLLGFYDPAKLEVFDPKTLHKEIAKSASKNFFALIALNKLRVTFESFVNGESVIPETAVQLPDGGKLAHLGSMYSDYLKGNAVTGRPKPG